MRMMTQPSSDVPGYIMFDTLGESFFDDLQLVQCQFRSTIPLSNDRLAFRRLYCGW